jgi:hypothetical protein
MQVASCSTATATADNKTMCAGSQQQQLNATSNTASTRPQTTAATATMQQGAATQHVCYFCLVQPPTYHSTSRNSYFFDKQIPQVTHAATTPPLP